MAHEPTPPQELAEHARFVRRVAGSLVRDEADADDAAQETLTLAMERPPRRWTSARGWLATAVRNVVRKRARGEGRRKKREQAQATPKSAPSVEEQASRAELVRSVTDALMQLAPAQRAVVMMRFYEGLPPREIAARLDISVNTVKSRLRLALGHMRTALGEDVGPDWRAMAVSTFGLQHWLAPVVPAATATTTAAAVSGGIAMGTTAKLTAALAAGVLLVGGFTAWTMFGDPDPAPDTSEEALLTGDREADEHAPELIGTATGDATNHATQDVAQLADDKTDGAGTGAATTTAEDNGTPAASSSDSSKLPTTVPTTLEGQILINGVPLRSGRGLIWRNTGWTTADGIPAGRPPSEEVDLGEEGLFRFEQLEDGNWALGVRLDDGVQRLFYKKRVTGKERNERAIMSLGESEVFGTVYDKDGNLAVGAGVRVSRSARGGSFIAQTVTDDQGRFRVGRLVGGGTWVSVAHDGDMNKSDSKYVRVPDSGSLEVPFGSAVGRFWFKGQVQCSDGTVVPGPGRIVLGMDEGTYGMVIIKYDKEGRFEHHLDRGRYRMSVWRPGGGRPVRDANAEKIEVQHDQMDAVWVLPGTRVRGTVAGGGTRRGAVWITPISEKMEDTLNNEQHAPTDKQGNFVFYGVTPGRYKITAERRGTSSAGVVAVLASQTEIEATLDVTETSSK